MKDSMPRVNYPYTHSLLSGVLWGGLFALVYAVLRKSMRGAWVCAAAVMSHWGLDLVVHRPDLPLVPGGGPLWGNMLVLTLALEAVLLGVGVWLYGRTTRAKDGVGWWALVRLVAFLAVIQIGNHYRLRSQPWRWWVTRSGCWYCGVVGRPAPGGGANDQAVRWGADEIPTSPSGPRCG